MDQNSQEQKGKHVFKDGDSFTFKEWNKMEQVSPSNPVVEVTTVKGKKLLASTPNFFTEWLYDNFDYSKIDLEVCARYRDGMDYRNEPGVMTPEEEEAAKKAHSAKDKEKLAKSIMSGIIYGDYTFLHQMFRWCINQIDTGDAKPIKDPKFKFFNYVCYGRPSRATFGPVTLYQEI